MLTPFYLIDSDLRAAPLADYLSSAGRVHPLPPPWELPPEALEPAVAPAVPVTPDGQLVPETLYPSSADPQVPFYMPGYHVTYAPGFVGDGRYIVGLHWRRPTDPPDGPLAFLTLSLLLSPTQAIGATAQLIPHDAVARFGYRLPVQGVPPAAPPRPVDPFVGVWRSPNLLPPEGLVRLEIQAADDHRAAVHALWTGNPQYTGGFVPLILHTVNSNGFQMPDTRHNDLGIAAGVVDGNTMTVTFTLVGGQTEVRMALRRDGVRLTAQVVRRSLGAGSHQELSESFTLAGGPDDGRPLQWVEIGALAPVSTTVRTAKLPITDKRDFDRIYQALSDPKYDARLQVRTFARAARRTWRQALLNKVALATQVEALREKKALVTELVARDPAPLADPAHPAFIAPAPHLELAQALAMVAEPAPPTAMRDELVVKPVLRQAFAPALAEAMAGTDVETRVGASVERAVPVSALLGADGRPALIDIQVESAQEIYPFCFPPDQFAYVYDLPPGVAPGADHVLVRQEVRDGAGQVVGVFYQDSAFPAQLYYQPQEFRLARADASPYLPDLRVVFYELATGGGAGGVQLNYKVRLGYRVVPYLVPHVLDLARQQLADSKAVFDALPAASTALTLRVPQDAGGGALAAVPRPDVQVRLDQALVDEIELSRTEFERIFAFFQAPSGDGLDGDVDAVVPGGAAARVPVRLSLRQTGGEVFGRTYLGPQGGGLHRVRLVNRVESPARVEALFRVALGGGAFAYPQSAPGQVVAPGGQLDLDYKADPPAAAVADLDPEIEVSVDADPLKLWPLLFINQGYLTDTFDLALSIDAGFFGAPPPAPPLTGVRVAFDDGTTVTLTAARLTATVSLRLPLLPRLMNDPQAKQYRYRVTNLLGADAHAGATTDWAQGFGDAPLTIIPAGA